MEIKQDVVTIVTTEDAIKIAQNNLIKLNEIIVRLNNDKIKLDNDLEQCKVDYKNEQLALKQKYSDKHHKLEEERKELLEYIKDHERVIETTKEHLKQFQEELNSK